MKRPGLFWEPFAGTAAVTRALVGAPAELVAWLGAKLRVRRELLACCGARPLLGAEAILLSDAGPWGWAWPVLLNPIGRAAVAAHFYRWARACAACEGQQRAGCVWCRGTGQALNASELWGWLASRPPAQDLYAAVAGWLWLQACSASGAAIWWAGDSSKDDRSDVHGGGVETQQEPAAGWRKGKRGGREEAAAEMGWRQGSANGRPDQPAGERNTSRNAGWRMGTGSGARECIVGETARRAGVEREDLRRTNTRGVDDSWRFSAGSGREMRASEKGRGTGTHSRGIIFPTTLARRVEGLGRGRWPVHTTVVHGSAQLALPQALQAGRELVALIDPPYHRDGAKNRLRTSYGWDMPLADVLQMAASCADVGARVVICEGGPLARDLGPGWYSYDLTARFSGRVVGQEWVTVNARVELAGLLGDQLCLPLAAPSLSSVHPSGSERSGADHALTSLPPLQVGGCA